MSLPVVHSWKFSIYAIAKRRGPQRSRTIMDPGSHRITTRLILLALLIDAVVVPSLGFCASGVLWPRVPLTRRRTPKDEQGNEDGDGGVGYEPFQRPWRSALQPDAPFLVFSVEDAHGR